ncbi:YigZ family protein [Metallumcola ferriviriculae]|uniref:YigZ family protein n=1 Tax=Metallumcola ferriviriculae TaxID=3039180 RepID=A0AAU0UHW7_9FIRM|nr:YigZ family protein [Desulfitibacteraceae bacterium MK1]
MQGYLTIARGARVEIEIKKSRFIAHVKQVADAEEAAGFIDTIKLKHREAAHNVSAFVAGIDHKEQRCSDDGEPKGTAGLPVLEVLRRNNITNTVVVVTRYFGGIKLGAGGLIRAYGRAARQGIESAGMVRMEVFVKLVVEADYSLMGIIEREAADAGARRGKHLFREKVLLNFWVRNEKLEQTKKRLVEATNDALKLESKEEKYLSV